MRRPVQSAPTVHRSDGYASLIRWMRTRSPQLPIAPFVDRTTHRGAPRALPSATVDDDTGNQAMAVPATGSPGDEDGRSTGDRERALIGDAGRDAVTGQLQH